MSETGPPVDGTLFVLIDNEAVGAGGGAVVIVVVVVVVVGVEGAIVTESVTIRPAPTLLKARTPNTYLIADLSPVNVHS